MVFTTNLFRPRAATALAALLAGAGCSGASQPGGIEKINHVVVIFQENWSFDSLFGKFPGANGLDKADAAAKQVDKNGQPYTTWPQPLDRDMKPDPDLPGQPAGGAVRPARFVRPDEKTKGNTIHKFYTEQLQINGGKMDKFVAWSENPGLVMSFYDASDLPTGKLAKQYVLTNNFFHGVFGDSYFEDRWNLEPLGTRDRAAKDLTNALNFASSS